MESNLYCNLVNLDEETLVIFKCKDNKDFKDIITKLKIIFNYGTNNRVVINNSDILKIAKEVYSIDHEVVRDVSKNIEINTLDFIFNKDKYELSTSITYNKKDFLNIYNELSRNNTMKNLIYTTIKNTIFWTLFMIIANILALGNTLILTILCGICYFIAGIIAFVDLKKTKNEKRFSKYLDKKKYKSKCYYENKIGKKAPNIIM